MKESEGDWERMGRSVATWRPVHVPADKDVRLFVPDHIGHLLGMLAQPVLHVHLRRSERRQTTKQPASEIVALRK